MATYLDRILEFHRARAAADQIPLPTGRELAALIVQAL